MTVLPLPHRTNFTKAVGVRWGTLFKLIESLWKRSGLQNHQIWCQAGEDPSVMEEIAMHHPLWPSLFHPPRNLVISLLLSDCGLVNRVWTLYKCFRYQICDTSLDICGRVLTYNCFWNTYICSKFLENRHNVTSTYKLVISITSYPNRIL